MTLRYFFILENWMRKAYLEIVDFARTQNISRVVSAARYIVSHLDIVGKRQIDAGLRFAASWSHTKFGPQIAARELVRFRNIQSPDVKRIEAENTQFLRTLILKAPKPSERGILLVSFEDELERLGALPRFEEIERRYRVLYMPSTKGVVSKSLLSFLYRAGRPVGILPSYLESEAPMVAALGPKAVFFSFHAASWVNGKSYQKEWTADKPIDLLMVATFASLKRHWLMFKALSQMPESVRATVVGVPIGERTEDSIMGEARLYGVDSRVAIAKNPTQPELRRLYAQAKLFCAFTHREGSFIAVVEALMANTPVVAFKNAEFGTKCFINERTGFLLDRRSFSGRSLLSCLERAEGLNPGPWALKELSAEVNCKRLNDALRERARVEGEVWTTDIAPFFSERLGLYYLVASNLDAGLSDAKAELECLGMRIA